MYAIAKEAQPITGRGVGYKLFTMKLIPDMSVKSMARVYPLLKEARKQGIIPWEWIVDETRELERASSLDDPDDYVRTIYPERTAVTSGGTSLSVIAPGKKQSPRGIDGQTSLIN
jgi:hypothetical protein